MLSLMTELDRMRIGRVHVTILAVALFAVLFDGYDILIVAYSLPLMAKQWSLTPPLAGSLVSAGLIGLALGSVLGGVLADAIGRKPTLIAALVVAALGRLATAAFAHSYAVFMPLRVVTGLGLGVLLPLASVYVREFAPTRRINLFVGLCQVGFGVGGTLAAVIGIALVPRFGWESMYWIGGGGIPLALLCVWLLPETPHYLATRQRAEPLRLLMTRMDPAQATRYRTASFRDKAAPSKQRFVLATLLARGKLWNTLCVWAGAFCLVMATYGATGWMPSVMIARGAGNAGGFALGGVLQFSSIIGVLGVAAMADRPSGPRFAMVLSLAVGAMAMATLSIVGASWTAAALVFAVGFLVLGTHATLYSFVAGLYSTDARAAGVGIMLGVGRIGGVCGPIVGGLLLQTFHTPTALFVAFAIAALGCATLLVLVRTVPAQMMVGSNAGA